VDGLGWWSTEISLAYLLLGGTDIVMQGFLSGRLLPIFGEIKLTIAGLATQIISHLLLASVALVHNPVLLLAGIIIFSVGAGFLEPALADLISMSADERQQGIVQGGNRSSRALTQVIGPGLAGILYTVGRRDTVFAQRSRAGSGHWSSDYRNPTTAPASSAGAIRQPLDHV
jgi:MFS transporter, DHA1 family, tetracycline resistance protein